MTSHPAHGPPLTRLAVAATNHCLTGCAIGEVLGLVIALAAGWGNIAAIALAISLAIAWVVAFPVNRWLIARGRGHAVVHGRHGPGDGRMRHH